MNLIVGLLVLVYFVLIWGLIARWLVHKGNSKFLGHVLGFVGGNVFSVAIALPMIPGDGETASVWGLAYGFFVLAVLVRLGQKTPPTTTDQYHAETAAAPKPARSASAVNSSPAGLGPAVKGPIQIDYCNADGVSSTRRIDVKAINGNTFKGFCHNRRAMRTFRIDRIEGDVIDLTTGELVPPRSYFN